LRHFVGRFPVIAVSFSPFEWFSVVSRIVLLKPPLVRASGQLLFFFFISEKQEEQHEKWWSAKAILPRTGWDFFAV